METTENYTETTGPVTRIGVVAESETEATAFAVALMGGQTSSWTEQGRPEFNEWEVVFENGY